MMYVCLWQVLSVYRMMSRTIECTATYTHLTVVYFLAQVVMATNRIDSLDPALIRSGTAAILCFPIYWVYLCTYIHTYVLI